MVHPQTLCNGVSRDAVDGLAAKAAGRPCLSNLGIDQSRRAQAHNLSYMRNINAGQVLPSCSR
jgi:hypothetical protein